MLHSRRIDNLIVALFFGAALTFSLPVNAAMLDFWTSDGWTAMDAEDGVGGGGYVGPGWGGQAFDAEYLFYKEEGNKLSIGLQSGFDILTGAQVYGGHTYYAGDLALGFNGGGYNYAIDFGLVTRNINGDKVGLGSGDQDAAGLYQATEWNNEISFAVSAPFGMDEGAFISGISTSQGSGSGSYFRTATIDLDSLGFEVTSFSAHWTMSCGNDVVEGTANVPEPSALLLMAGGLLGLFGSLRGRKA